MSDTLRRLFTATLIIGISGSGKSSLLATAAEYLWEVHQRILLLYCWDGGAIPTIVQRRMRQGLIRFWRARTRSAEGLAIETLYLATKGYWPRRINPETGETDPAVQMVPPVTTKYELSCPTGHPLQTVPTPSMIVPTYCTDCKQMMTPSDLQVKETVLRTKGFELVGGVAFDSLSSMSTDVLHEMDRQRGAGLIGGEKPAFGGVVKSGAMSFGGNNRADVYFAQTRADQLVRNSLAIPYLVEGPIFTGLTMEASEEGLPIVGLELPGRAATNQASTWFGNVMEAAKVLDTEGKTHFALYLRPFTDAQNRRHLLKSSASPGAVPSVIIDPPEEENRPNTNVHLGSVYKLLDEDLRRSLEADQQGATQPLPAPALANYGEAVTVEAPQPVVPRPHSMGYAETLVSVSLQTPTTPVAPDTPIPQPRRRARAAAAPDATPVATPPGTGVSAPPPPGPKPPQRAPGA
jgi:hypothetical protein